MKVIDRLQTQADASRHTLVEPPDQVGVMVGLADLDALLAVARAARALERALPGYEITGDEVVQEERALSAALEPLLREEGRP